MKPNLTLPTLQFTLCDTRYALSIHEVEEVAAMVKATRLGPAQDGSAVYGVVNRHGTPVTLVDLRRVFVCEAATVNADSHFVIVHARGPSGDSLVGGFIVDQVLGMVYLDEAAIHPVQNAHRYLRGVASVVEGDATELVQWIAAAPILADYLENQPHIE